MASRMVTAVLKAMPTNFGATFSASLSVLTLALPSSVRRLPMTLPDGCVTSFAFMITFWFGPAGPSVFS